MRRIPLQTRRKIIQVTTTCGLIFTLMMAYVCATSPYFKAGGGFQILLTRMGWLAPIFFIGIQISQTIYPIIPMGLHNVIGVLVFGQGWGFVYNCVGMVIGSAINFYLGRRFGEDFIKAFLSDKQFDKYVRDTIKGKGFVTFIKVGFVAPIFPDDIFCMICGLSNLSFKEFMKLVLLYRPASLFFFTFVSSHLITYFYHFFFG